MEIIDFRLRPPYKGFLANRVFADRAVTGRFTEQIGLPQPASANERSLPMMLAEMDAAGIVLGVMVGRNTTLGRVPNDEVMQIANEFPGRFFPIGSIDPTSRRDAMRQIEQAIALGFRFMTMEPGLLFNPMHFDDRRLYPIYGALEDLQWPLMLMAGGIIGPDISYSSPEHLDRVLADFPDLKVVISHGGWPWVAQVIHMAFRRRNLYVSPDMYLHNMAGMCDYIQAANGFLSDRMLFATDYPLCPLVEYTQWFRGLPLTELTMRKVFSTMPRRYCNWTSRWLQGCSVSFREPRSGPSISRVCYSCALDERSNRTEAIRVPRRCRGEAGQLRLRTGLIQVFVP